MIRRFPMVEASPLSGRAGARSPSDPSPPRLAATVMCVRDGDRGVEVFMLHRVSTMAFAPSMHVFPGGGVDAEDSRADLPWSGPPVDEWARRMRTDEPTARMLIAAAVREVFEETGVLLGGPSRLDEPWAAARSALVAHETSLADVLIAGGEVLRSDLLGYRAHWTTPEFEPRRYDTRFFAALVPDGQVADGGSSEAQSANWVRPADLLDAYAAGAALLLPPTVVCLEQVAAAGSAADFVREEPPVHEVIPWLEESADGLAIVMDLP